MQQRSCFWSSFLVELSVETCTQLIPSSRGRLLHLMPGLQPDEWQGNCFPLQRSLWWHEHTQALLRARRWCNLTQTLNHNCSPEILPSSCFDCSNYIGDEKREKIISFSWEGNIRCMCTLLSKFLSLKALLHVELYSVAGFKSNIPPKFIPGHPQRQWYAQYFNLRAQKWPPKREKPTN